MARNASLGRIDKRPPPQASRGKNGMSAPATDRLHDERTQRRQLEYLFTAKHRGADSDAARWLPSLTAAEEFSVFNLADLHDLSDGRGWLYGVLRAGAEGLR